MSKKEGKNTRVEGDKNVANQSKSSQNSLKDPNREKGRKTDSWGTGREGGEISKDVYVIRAHNLLITASPQSSFKDPNPHEESCRSKNKTQAEIRTYYRDNSPRGATNSRKLGND